MKPPSFYPGKKLKADDLIQLENYLSVRSFTVNPDYGVIRLSRRDVRGETKRTEYTFFLDKIIGITPSGGLVNFDRENYGGVALKFVITISNEPKIYDIYVRNAHSKKGETEEHQPKFSLEVKEINSTEQEKILPGKNDADTLYIGRYRLQLETLPEMIQPPLLYHLSAIMDWKDWKEKMRKPILQAMQEIAEKYSEDSVVLNFLAEMALNYQMWPASRLYQASRQIQWLTNNTKTLFEEVNMKGWEEEQSINYGWELLQNKFPDQLPTIISDILGSGGNVGWQLLPENEYAVDPEGFTLSIKREFKNSHRIKIQFYVIEKCPSMVTVVANGDLKRLKRQEGEDLLHKKVWYYEIELNSSSEDHPFELRYPKEWGIDYKIYFRTNYEKPSDTLS